MSETQLSHAIDITEALSQYDTEAKYLISNKQVLARIMKYSVREYKDCSIDEIINYIEGTPEVSSHPVLPQGEKIAGLKEESAIPGEGMFTFDIRFYALTPHKEMIKIILNVELQKSYYPGYHFCSRGIFYCSRMISEQVHTEFIPENYDDIQKVYSIWICMEPPSKYSNTISEYSMAQNNIYGDFQGEERYDLLTVLIIRLSTDNPRNQKNKLLDMLNVLLSRKLKARQKKEILETEHQMQMTTTNIEGDMRSMCNLSELIVEETEKRVTEEVTQKVTQNVTSRETINSVNSLMKNLHLSLEKACEILDKTVADYRAAEQLLDEIQK